MIILIATNAKGTFHVTWILNDDAPTEILGDGWCSPSFMVGKMTFDIRSLFVEKQRAFSFHNDPTDIVCVIVVDPFSYATVPSDPINSLWITSHNKNLSSLRTIPLLWSCTISFVVIKFFFTLINLPLRNCFISSIGNTLSITLRNVVLSSEFFSVNIFLFHNIFGNNSLFSAFIIILFYFSHILHIYSVNNVTFCFDFVFPFDLILV